jgi:protein phosphatase
LPVTGFDHIEYASLTDVGVRRSHNQDAHRELPATDIEKWREGGHVFVVADGMGAHAVGELASEMAVNNIPHTYHKHAQQGAVAGLRKAFIETNATIHNKGQQNREFEGMGTTTTALVLRPEGAWIGHVGDSRAYRIRDGVIEQLSFDHSLQWELARRQGVDPNGLQGIPTNVIVRSLGPEPLVHVDIEGPHPLRDGDTFLLCSDGLSGQVTDGEIGAIATALAPAEACRFLVDLANLRGGPDNITVLIVRIGGESGRDPSRQVKRVRPRPAIPWPFVALLLGVLLAGGAVALTVTDQRGLGFVALLLAVAALIGGSAGLAVQHGQEKRRTAAEPNEPPRPRIHRQAPCVIDRPLIEKLARAAATLKQRMEERKWEADWATYQQHFERGESLAKNGDLVEAVREYCRSMRPLNEALRGQRHKDEGFPPVWDKGQ